MTADEAAKLRPGDRVETLQGGGWVAVEVVRLVATHGPLRVMARRLGLTRGGYEFPVRFRSPHQLRHNADLPPAPANVFADWLDDHCEHSAAAKLRAAFPLYPAEGVA